MTDSNDRMEQPMASHEQSEQATYEPPRIERVLTADEMEREVMFAGPGVTTGDIPLP